MIILITQNTLTELGSSPLSAPLPLYALKQHTGLKYIRYCTKVDVVRDVPRKKERRANRQKHHNCWEAISAPVVPRHDDIADTTKAEASLTTKKVTFKMCLKFLIACCINLAQVIARTL